MGHEVVKHLTGDVHNELLHVLKKVNIIILTSNHATLRNYLGQNQWISALIYWNKIISIVRQKQSNWGIEDLLQGFDGHPPWCILAQ